VTVFLIVAFLFCGIVHFPLRIRTCTDILAGVQIVNEEEETMVRNIEANAKRETLIEHHPYDHLEYLRWQLALDLALPDPCYAEWTRQDIADAERRLGMSAARGIA